MKRVVLVCPGRGTYTRSELGSIGSAARADATGVRPGLLAEADRLRTQSGRRRVSELDGAERFSALHLAGENAAALIFTATASDAATLDPALVPVAVVGNSMGWYSALHVARAFDFSAGFALADTMGSYQTQGVVGGQVIYPVVDEQWQRDPAQVREVGSVIERLRAAGARVYHSIHLGGYEVLAGDDAAVKGLLGELPKVMVKDKEYPFQLLGHSAFHTPLLASTSERAKVELRDLPWGLPAITLIDGRGVQHRPHSASGAALRDYTLGAQVVDTYDFSRSVRVALREYAPDALVLLGPGDSLGGAIAQILIEERWNGLRSRADFAARQATDDPVLISLGRRAPASSR